MDVNYIEQIRERQKESGRFVTITLVNGVYYTGIIAQINNPWDTGEIVELHLIKSEAVDKVVHFRVIDIISIVEAHPMDVINFDKKERNRIYKEIVNKE